MTVEIRRVVTGHDKNGRAVISLNGPPTAMPLKAVPGTIFYEIWNTNGSPAEIDNGPDPTLRPLQLKPKKNGSIIRVLDIPPDSVQQALSPEQAAAAFAEVGAPHASDAHGRHRLMHRTETVDYGILISGELWLVVDEGEVRLKPGDIVVQRGTNHAWSNRTDKPARIVFVLLDGHFAPELAK